MIPRIRWDPLRLCATSDGLTSEPPWYTIYSEGEATILEENLTGRWAVVAQERKNSTKLVVNGCKMGRETNMCYKNSVASTTVLPVVSCVYHRYLTTLPLPRRSGI